MNFNYCTGKNMDCFDTLLVQSEIQSEKKEKSEDGIECSVPEQCGRMHRLVKK
jgi:hypothetical protein